MTATLAEKFAHWAEAQFRIKALVLIVSHVRAPGSVNHADAESDWDFQLLTSDMAF